MLDAFRAAAASAGNRPLLCYFDSVLTYADVDRLSDSMATALQDGGFQRGDRAALYLQNVPQYLIALLATWKAGGDCGRDHGKGPWPAARLKANLVTYAPGL